MKKNILYLLFAGIALSSCEKDPDLDQLDSDFTVYTQYDERADFGSAQTYYLPDSVLTAGGGLKTAYVSNENTNKLVAEVESEMNSRGYTRTDNKADADLGVQMTYIENNVNMVGFVGGFWDGWWDPFYWGSFWTGGWYYPYPVHYSYQTGNIVLEMVDLRNAESNSKQLPIIWLASSEGLTYGNSHTDVMLIQRAIQQSFEQSSYINRK